MEALEVTVAHLSLCRGPYTGAVHSMARWVRVQPSNVMSLW